MNKSCENCQKSFEAKRSYVRFCNRSCSAKWRHSNFPTPKTCFKPGVKVWNKGKNISGMSGKSHTLLTKEKMRVSSSGELASNWRGGITSENYRIRRGRRYADWRKEVFLRDGYACVVCKNRSAKGNRVRLEADHILPFASHPESRFDVNNGRTLCEPCHRKTPTWGMQFKKQQDFTGKEAVKL